MGEDADRAWGQVEACLVRAHGASAKPPRARLAMQDVHPRTLFGGDAVTARLSICSARKRRLQQMLTIMGHPERKHIVECLKRKLVGDPDVGWAAWGMLHLSEEAVEALGCQGGGRPGVVRGA